MQGRPALAICLKSGIARCLYGFKCIRLKFQKLGLKLNFPIRKIFLQYLSFILGLVTSLLVDFFLLNQLNINLAFLFNIPYLNYFPTFTIIIFIIIFMILNYFFKIFTREDYLFLDKIISGDKKVERLIKKLMYNGLYCLN